MSPGPFILGNDSIIATASTLDLIAARTRPLAVSGTVALITARLARLFAMYTRHIYAVEPREGTDEDFGETDGGFA
jgi:hypothetical protein